MSQAPTQPEKGAFQPPEAQKSTESTGNSADAGKSFEQKIEDKAAEFTAKIQEYAKNNIEVKGGLAVNKSAVIVDKYVVGVEKAKKTYQDRYKTLQNEIKAQRAAIMEQEATVAMTNIHLEFETIVNIAKKDGKITDQNIEILNQLSRQMDKMKLNPEKLALLQKILAKSTLEPQDYQKIVSFLHPADLRTIQGDANKLFEASESGLLIAAMSPEQRLELVKAFYQLKPAAEAQDFVDALIYAKVLTLQQAETLSNQEGVKPAEQQRLKQALENGNFSAGIREYEKLLASTAHANEGRGAGSIFSDNTTMAALGMIGLGGLTAILNAMVVFDPAHPVESLKKFMQTGYGPMGAATATIGTLMLAGTPEFAQRGWEAAKRFFTGSDLLPKIREEARGEIELLLINTIDSNPFLIRTLLADSQENHQTVFQIFQSKIDAVNNHQLQDFTLEDIYKDLSEDQKAKFQILANNCEGNTDEEKRQTAFIFVKKFMEGCDGLGIKTTKQLLDLQAAIEEDKRKQAAGSTAPKATEQPEKPATN